MLMHQEKADELGLLTSDIAVVLLDGLFDQVPSALVPTYQGIQSNHLADIDLLSQVNLHELLLIHAEPKAQRFGLMLGSCSAPDMLSAAPARSPASICGPDSGEYHKS